MITMLYFCIGLTGLCSLRRAFANFAKGEILKLVNSRNLRRSLILLLMQTLATPLHCVLLSVRFSSNDSAGDSIFSSVFGSAEI